MNTRKAIEEIIKLARERTAINRRTERRIERDDKGQLRPINGELGRIFKDSQRDEARRRIQDFMMSLPEKEARKIVALMYWGRDNGHPDIQVVHNQFDSQHTEILVMMACDKLPLADYLIAAVRLAEASGLDIEGDFDSEVEGSKK